MVSPLVRWGIPLLAAALANGFVYCVDYAERALGTPPAERSRRVALAAASVFAWMALTAVLALRGTLRNFDVLPPPIVFVFASAPALALGVGLSPAGERLARGLPLVSLVALQGFRLPLELIMHQAAAEGLMPRVMSYSGYNYDIVSGVTAALLGGLLAVGSVPLWVLAVWNALGILLLVNVVVIAVAASPLFRAFGQDQVNVWVTEFPYVWMVVMVTAAALAHVVLSRRLWLDYREGRTRAQGSR